MPKDASGWGMAGFQIFSPIFVDSHPTFGSPTIPHFSEVPNLPRRAGALSASFLCFGGMLLPLAIRSSRLSRAHCPTLPAWLLCLVHCLRDLAQQVNIHMSQRSNMERVFLCLQSPAKAIFATPSNNNTRNSTTRGRHVMRF